MARKNKKRSLAALRAWRIRRRNAKRRSEIAKRGWITRRKNAKKFSGTPSRRKQPTGKKRGSPPTLPRKSNKRSKAAKKGWITRRRNANLEKEKQQEKPVIIVDRMKYVSKRGKETHFQITRKGEEITRLEIGRKVYTKKADLEPFQALIEQSVLIKQRPGI